MHWSFAHLCSEKLYADHAKCVFGQTWVEYLGYVIGGGVVEVDPAKTCAIMDWPELACVKHI